MYNIIDVTRIASVGKHIQTFAQFSVCLRLSPIEMYDIRFYISITTKEIFRRS